MSNHRTAEQQFTATLDQEASRLALSLTSEQQHDFWQHLELLEAWNDRAGLTAIRDRDEAARRLFGESLALLVALRQANIDGGDQPLRVADLGPGGGFPGIPMRIVDPSLRFTLIESQRRRCEFLEVVVAELALDGTTVLHARAEEAGRREDLRASFDLVVARALAPLAVLVEYALPLLSPGGILATPKGSRAAGELAEAEAAITALGGTALPSVALSLPDDVPPQQVLLVRRDGDLDDRYPRRAGVPSKRPIR